jgi:hypothetical protein
MLQLLAFETRSFSILVKNRSKNYTSSPFGHDGEKLNRTTVYNPPVIRDSDHAGDEQARDS